MFIFFCEKENEPKEIAPVTRPFGLPCASRIGRSLWNSLALKQPQLLLARFCDAPSSMIWASQRGRSKPLRL